MPKGLRKFYFSFEKTGLTRFGGLSLFQSFCKFLGLRHFLQLYVRWPDYSPAVPSRRSFPRSSLCDHSRHWPSREHTIFDSQWFDPTAFGPARLPAPRYLEKLFMALQFQASQLSEDCPRPTPLRTLPALGSSLQRHRRRRYYSKPAAHCR